MEYRLSYCVFLFHFHSNNSYSQSLESRISLNNENDKYSDQTQQKKIYSSLWLSSVMLSKDKNVSCLCEYIAVNVISSSIQLCLTVSTFFTYIFLSQLTSIETRGEEYVLYICDYCGR